MGETFANFGDFPVTWVLPKEVDDMVDYKGRLSLINGKTHYLDFTVRPIVCAPTCPDRLVRTSQGLYVTRVEATLAVLFTKHSMYGHSIFQDDKGTVYVVLNCKPHI